MYENIQFRKANMAFDGSYFYMFDENNDMLLQKLSDGQIAFSYPLDTPIGNSVTSVEYDGTNFWSMQDITDGVSIKYWQIFNNIVTLKDTYVFKPNFNSEAFTVEHYNTFLSASISGGENNIEIKDDYLSVISSGTLIHIGPNTDGNFEEIYAAGINGSKIVLSSGVSFNYSVDDRVDFNTSLWVFNSHDTGSLYKYSLSKFVPPASLHWDGDHTNKQYSWEYLIAEGNGSRTDYQMAITAHYGSGTDHADNVYLNNKCEGDFSDLRFTTSDGETSIDYWIEDKTDFDNAKIWLKIPYISSYPDITNIYCYYSTASGVTVSGISNPKDTFNLSKDKICYVKYSGKSGHPLTHQALIDNYNYDTVQESDLVDIIYPSDNAGSSFNYYFTTFMYVTNSGVWQFAVDSDDASEVEIDGIVVASWYGGHGWCNCYDHNGSITLDIGWHRFIARHEEDSGGDRLRVYFKAPGDTNWYVFSKVNLNGKADIYAKLPNSNILKTYQFIVDGLPISYAPTEPTSSGWGAEETVVSGSSMDDWQYRKLHEISNSVPDVFLDSGTYVAQFDAYDNDSSGEIALRLQNQSNDIIDVKATTVQSSDKTWVTQEETFVINIPGYYDIKGRQIINSTYIWGLDNVTLNQTSHGVTYEDPEYDNISACTFNRVHCLESSVIPSIVYVKGTNLKYLNTNSMTIYAVATIDNLKTDQLTEIKIYDIAISDTNIYRLQKAATYYGHDYNWTYYNYVLSTVRRFLDTINVSVYPVILPANAVNTATVTALVNDQYGEGLVNSPIIFSDDDDYGFITRSPVYTDYLFGTGEAVSYYKAGIEVRLVTIEGKATQYN